MKESTRSEYLSLANHFVATRLKGESPTPKKITDALKACAGEYRPGSWRRIRRGLVLHQEAAGFQKSAERIAATENPVTQKDFSGQLRTPEAVKKKQKRVKSVKPADEAKLIGKLLERGDRETVAAIVLAKHLGVRPSEMHSLQMQGNRVDVIGIKKRDDRGADRSITVTSAVALREVEVCLNVLQDGDSTIKQISDRLRNAGKSLWPARSAVPNLYSWRHQMGSNLKASGMDRRQIAYVMGHQATESADSYGNRRTASGKSCIEPAAGADLSQVRETHSEPLSQQEPVIMTPAEKMAGMRKAEVAEKRRNTAQNMQKRQENQRTSSVDDSMSLG